MDNSRHFSSLHKVALFFCNYLYKNGANNNKKIVKSKILDSELDTQYPSSTEIFTKFCFLLSFLFYLIKGKYIPAQE